MLLQAIQIAGREFAEDHPGLFSILTLGKPGEAERRAAMIAKKSASALARVVLRANRRFSAAWTTSRLKEPAAVPLPARRRGELRSASTGFKGVNAALTCGVAGNRLSGSVAMDQQCDGVLALAREAGGGRHRCEPGQLGVALLLGYLSLAQRAQVMNSKGIRLQLKVGDSERTASCTAAMAAILGIPQGYDRFLNS
ncbi:hypothetical protein CEG18_08430 [Pseudomonas nitroreducens]|uniref:Uncharacterized protein n=1 Tax=Pseudomonas nitroreducens TaxID=46680 RepID=A0A246F994_PSENT|nr:hypothetical protein CEG18_08430 [Pseudomonas nitroreducens]